jgi:hypothetical protein
MIWLKRSENNGSPGAFEQDLSNSIQEDEIPVPFTCGVYPNPFTSRLTLQCISAYRSDIRIVMSDIQGRVVKSISKLEMTSGHNRYEIHTGDLDAGVYFISVQTPHGQYNTKVICA